MIFDDSPLLFQSLSFEKGSQQGMHQDTAYIVVDSPLELAASWIALQDVEPGSGELMYYEGSHRLPEYLSSVASSSISRSHATARSRRTSGAVSSMRTPRNTECPVARSCLGRATL